MLPGGQTYFLKLSGTSSDVDLRLVNLVQRNSSAKKVNVYDTAGSDSFEFQAGDSHLVSVNGVEYAFAAGEVDTVAFNCGSGNGQDTAMLYGTEDVERVVMRRRSTKMTGSGFQATVSGAVDVTAFGRGGDDVVRLRDSAGSDTLLATPNSAELSGPGFRLEANDFRYIHAFGTPGSGDVAHLYDSPGNDRLVVKPNLGKLTGQGFFIRAKLFDDLNVHATAGGPRHGRPPRLDRRPPTSPASTRLPAAA